METKRVSQIQCPNCGEYRMIKVERFSLGQILLSAITFGLYAVIYAIAASKTRDPKLKPKDHIKCQNCGSRWIFER